MTLVFVIMRVDLISKEYPPDVYGGAGVHVAELVKALRNVIDVRVHCFGASRDEPDTFAYDVPDGLASANPALATLGVDLEIAEALSSSALAHSHTWYANEAGRLAQVMYGIPHVVTAHSLEPFRPWKAEQLAGGYRISSEIERRSFESADAVIAVSHGMRRDILLAYPQINAEKLHVVHNGIDANEWKPTLDASVLARYRVDEARPTVIFVGRITRQKGLVYLLRALTKLPPDVQIILCAGAPDTEEIKAEFDAGVKELTSQRTGVIWVHEHLSRHDLSVLLTASTVFVCPSIYEPLGIVNLEAMACGLPVVATETGGIPEVVVDGETGWLVPIEQSTDGTGTPRDPEKFVSDLATTLNTALSDASIAAQFGLAARARAQASFDWTSIAAKTVQVYSNVL
jgi:starch synthase